MAAGVANGHTLGKKGKAATVGVYYFDGWASHTNRWMNSPADPWAADGPWHLSRRLVKEFPEREPVWGWHDDKLEIMERQIDLAADNGVDVFAFCWYWSGNQTKTDTDTKQADQHPLHISMNLFRKAANKDKMKYFLMVCDLPDVKPDSTGRRIYTTLIRYWAQFFKDPQYYGMDSKPVVMIYNGAGVSDEMCAVMQEVARSEGFKKGIALIGGGSGATRGRAGYDCTANYNGAVGWHGGNEEHPYRELIDAEKKNWKGSAQQPHIPTIHAGADYRPWEGPDGLHGSQPPSWYFLDNTPDAFQQYLREAILWMNDHPTQTTKEKLVMIYAWNEMGEGGYLVPTKGDPEAAKLKKIKETVDEMSKSVKKRK
jgi:hypothetical protein